MQCHHEASARCQVPAYAMQGTHTVAGLDDLRKRVKRQQDQFERAAQGQSPYVLLMHIGRKVVLPELELENLKRISDLTAIGELRQLQGLVIEGSMWTTQVVDSLAPLARLSCLRYLALPNLKAKDKTLSPLFSLSSLERFHAAQWWSEEEVSQLRRANPKL